MRVYLRFVRCCCCASAFTPHVGAGEPLLLLARTARVCSRLRRQASVSPPAASHSVAPPRFCVRWLWLKHHQGTRLWPTGRTCLLLLVLSGVLQGHSAGGAGPAWSSTAPCATLFCLPSPAYAPLLCARALPCSPRRCASLVCCAVLPSGRGRAP